MAARVRINLKNMPKIKKAVRDSIEEAVEDVSDDLVRTSSEAAPHDNGILEQSFGKSVAWKGDKCIAVVDYSVKEDNGQNGFDYAAWIHEDTDYNLGEKSEAKAAGGGGVGMSGKTYEVGHHFLTRPLYGEAEAYKNHMQSIVDSNL
ncbi:hypothetical protein [Peribacillus muralis]|uniref:hypothetical protein n=1 Tax=Peribacillus muralis TaxID=264697 RepID=UPI003670AC95